jgi:ABC-type glycerol-3-phosphate transport system substrate-binding protein
MFAPPAADSGDTWLTVQPAGGIAVWKKSAHPEAAEQFLDFISGPDQSRKLAETNQLISPADAVSGQLPDLYAGLAPYFASGRTIPAIVSDFPNASVMYDQAGSSIQGLFTGQRTTQQVLQDFDTAVDKG